MVVAHVPVEATPFGEPVRLHVRTVIVGALRRSGYDVTDFAVRSADDIKTLAEVHAGSVVFNLCYGLRRRNGVKAMDQPGIAGALSDLGMTIVGSDAAAQRRCQDKLETARVVAEIGVDSPMTLTLAEALDQGGPLVVKPRAGAAHRGVRLVTEAGLLADSPPGDGELIQEYVDGPEYTIGIVGSHTEDITALPVVRIRYRREGTAPAVYDWATTTSAPDAPGRFGLAARSLELFRGLGLGDYARFDFRVVAGRGPVLLDANALPNLAPRQLMATSARWAGMQYPDLLRAIVASALDRSRQ